jgi:hypothetical protein
MAQNRTCNLSVTGRPSSPLRLVFKVLPHPALSGMQIIKEYRQGYHLFQRGKKGFRFIRSSVGLS